MMLRAASGLSMWLRWMALLLYRKFLPSRWLRLRLQLLCQKTRTCCTNFYVEKIADSSYLKTELLLKNKTDRILNIGCDSVIVNGCAVDISKFVEVPAGSTFLHEWTNGAEMFLKYRIDTVKTFAMVFEYHNADSYIAGKSIQTREIEIE